MITIQIQCKDINEFQQISALLGGTPQVNTVKSEPAAPKAAKKTATKAPPKAADVTPEEQDVPLAVEQDDEPVPTEETKPTTTKVTKTVTKDMVHAALQKVNTLKGIAVARATLAKFDCPRISDLGADQYTEFLQACEEACQ